MFQQFQIFSQEFGAQPENLVAEVEEAAQPKKPAPADVNRRAAVLLTRKKQQAISSAEIEETESTPNKTEIKKKGAIKALTDETLENQETEVQGATSNPAGTS